MSNLSAVAMSSDECGGGYVHILSYSVKRKHNKGDVLPLS